MHPRTRKALKISAAAVSVLIIASAFKVYKVGYANPSCPSASSPPHVIGILRWIRSRDCIGMLRYARQREGDLKVGDRAPDALLVSLDGRSRQPLLQATNGKPTVLVFGSFTWPPFRRSVGRLTKMQERYRDRALFQTVYIREAHPIDEWQKDLNEKEGVCYRQPKTLSERVAIANDFVKRFNYALPLAVDTMGDKAEKIYAGWPERLYIIDAKGVIAYKGEPGPRGYHPEEVEAWLAARFPEKSLTNWLLERR